MIMDIKDVSWPGWETVGLLGRGSYGGVYEIQRNVLGNVEKAALKVISIPQSESELEELRSEGLTEESISKTFEYQLKNIVDEYAMMRKLNGCSNIVHSDDVHFTPKPDGVGWDIYIKMELLTPLTKGLPMIADEDTVIRIGKDMCRALERCNQFSIVHRDIKPQNMFLSDSGDCKLGDFGIAKTIEKTSGGTKIGTFKYMAPEVYHGQPYGSSADIYSLGLVLYWLLNERRMPFVPLPPAQPLAGVDGDAANRRLSGAPIPPPKNGCEELKNIVLKACAYDPKDRYKSAEEMRIALENIGKGIPVVIPPVQPATPSMDSTVRANPAPQTVYAPVAAVRPGAAPVKAQKKSGKGIWIVLGILALVIAGVIAALLLSGGGDTDDESDRKAPTTRYIEESDSDGEDSGEEEKVIRVPSLANCSRAEAMEQLNDLGLSLRVDAKDFEYNEDVPAGMVIRTEPAEGTILKKGQTVTLILSAGEADKPATTEPPKIDPGELEGNIDIAGEEDGETGEESQPLAMTDRYAVISVGSDHVVGIKDGGKVLYAGFPGGASGEIASWKNIVSLASGSMHTVGLKTDGSVVAAGENRYGQCDVREWKDIVAIGAGGSFTVGLTKDGNVVFAGDNAGIQRTVSSWTDIVDIAGGFTMVAGLKSDGTVVVAGSDMLTAHKSWTDIIAVSAGANHVVGLRKDGTVVAASLFNTEGQCNVSDWTDIVAISAAMNQTVGLKADGTVVAVGENRYGQCDTEQWRDIRYVAAGQSHTVGVKNDGSVVIVGWNAFSMLDAASWTDIAADKKAVELPMIPSATNSTTPEYKPEYEPESTEPEPTEPPESGAVELPMIPG